MQRIHGEVHATAESLIAANVAELNAVSKWHTFINLESKHAHQTPSRPKTRSELRPAHRALSFAHPADASMWERLPGNNCSRQAYFVLFGFRPRGIVHLHRFPSMHSLTKKTMTICLRTIGTIA
jgi:hypothetical protein